MTVSAPGFANAEVTSIAVNAGNVVRADARLTLASATQSVLITAEASLVHTENQTIGQNNFFLTELPRDSRDIYSFLYLNPNITQADSDGGFKFLGSLRPPFIYAPGNSFYREAFFWDRLRENRSIILPGDGRRLMQFVHVRDLVYAPPTRSRKFVRIPRDRIFRAGGVNKAQRVLKLKPIDFDRRHNSFPKPDYSFEDSLIRPRRLRRFWRLKIETDGRPLPGAAQGASLTPRDSPTPCL